MEWIKVSDKLPATRQKCLFVVSGHFGGPVIHLGVFVPHYENQFDVWKNVFIGNMDSFWKSHQISHWSELPELPK